MILNDASVHVHNPSVEFHVEHEPRTPSVRIKPEPGPRGLPGESAGADVDPVLYFENALS